MYALHSCHLCKKWNPNQNFQIHVPKLSIKIFSPHLALIVACGELWVTLVLINNNIYIFYLWELHNSFFVFAWFCLLICILHGHGHMFIFGCGDHLGANCFANRSSQAIFSDLMTWGQLRCPGMTWSWCFKKQWRMSIQTRSS